MTGQITVGEEIDRLRSDTLTHGTTSDTEQTYAEVVRYGDLLAQPAIDWATLGAITQALRS